EQVQEWLERYIDIENLLDKGTDFHLPSKQRIETIGDVEEAALNVREEWRLGFDPIEGLIEICEDRGIKVGLIDGQNSFDALTLWANNDIPVFILQEGLPGDYQRFCLARELGYLILEAAEHTNLAKATHRFANALLAPRPAVELELGP